MPTTKYMLIILLLVFSLSLAAETTSRFKASANLGPLTGLVFSLGGTVGYLVSSDDSTGFDGYINLTYVDYFYNGTSVGINGEWRRRKKRFYHFVSLGFDVFGTDPEYETLLIPHIVGGLGYNFAEWEKGSAFIEWDIGLQPSITNINLGITF